ncbi:MAG: autotransporter outer membrane beta-barrel domain-containing protein [Geobacteraceae bacterium]|nr:autotransporter outer membrane beta-barrel domain-containing protein [Geobacteraceae bacterium]
MKLILMLTFCLALLASPACAGVEEWFLYPSLQYFTWKEFSGNRRLVMEEGPLYAVGGGVRFDLYRKSLLVNVKGEIFGGEVGYRGQTQNLDNAAQHARPLKTDVTYFGTKLEGDVGWRLPLGSGSIEPFAGIGYRWWQRDLANSTALDTDGNAFPVGGFTEVWHTLYSRLGLHGNLAVGSDLTLFAEGGGRYPFLNRNVADFPGAGTVTIKPEPRWSLFAELGARYGKFRPALFYEGFRFGQSQAVPIGGNRFLLQPESDSDIFGVNFGWAFK